MMEDKDYIDFRALAEEYLPNDADDDLVREIKEDFFNILSEGERRVLCVYMEFGSYAGVAKFLGVSAPTAKKAVEAIKEKLK